MTDPSASAYDAFRAARDVLLRHRDDLDAATAAFAWPDLPFFNWAIDWFDRIAAGNERTALVVAAPDRSDSVTFAALARRSSQVANWLAEAGIRPGDRVLLLLDNRVAVWEMMLALMKIRAVAVPVFTTLSADEIAERYRRAGAEHVVATSDIACSLRLPQPAVVRVSIGGEVDGWLDYAQSAGASDEFVPAGPTPAGELSSFFFTSGSTSRPKLVTHSHVSYAVGHLSSMYWNGLRPGDIHVNVSSPGWAKHPWSSLFAPWNAEATIVSIDTRHASPAFVLDTIVGTGATSFCAPPTIWRSIVRVSTMPAGVRLREAVSVGEPLTDEIVGAVQRAWGIRVRNGYGQSEVTAMAGVTPGSTGDPTVLGRPLPGYDVVICRPGTEEPATTGEFCLDIRRWPTGLMRGYLDEAGPAADAVTGNLYRTGDLVRREPDGTMTFIGRIKDVYVDDQGEYVSPAWLERYLLAHPAVGEAAVVQIDGARGPAAKAFVVTDRTWAAGPATAEALLDHSAAVAASGEVTGAISVIEFVELLPRTESGKIYRELLRARPRDAVAEYTVETHGSVTRA